MITEIQKHSSVSLSVKEPFYHFRNLLNNSQPVIFDVGAHHGETIKKFNKKLSIKKIYSFEASPVNFRILLKNINKFNSSKFEIYNFALGEKLSNSFINQTIESSSSTINKLNKKSRYYFRKLKVLKIKDKDQYYKRIPIKIITLDKFIEEKKISYIDGIF